MQSNQNAMSLKDVRLRAKVSQTDLAELLDVSQSTISRYEDDPDQVPVGHDRKWREHCGQLQAAVAWDPGEGLYQEIRARLESVTGYFESKPATPCTDIATKKQIPADSHQVKRHAGKTRSNKKALRTFTGQTGPALAAHTAMCQAAETASETAKPSSATDIDTGPQFKSKFPGAYELPDTNDLLRQLKLLAKKPVVAFPGMFDGGKSTVVNTMLGKSLAPTSYQPTSSMNMLVMHTDDRPDHVKETVTIMGAGFDLEKYKDKEHWEKHKIAAGDSETTLRFASHFGEDSGRKDLAGGMVIAFVDAPILKHCSILDFPGYGSSNEDTKKVEMAQKMADVIVYTSTAQSAMNSEDIAFFQELILKNGAVASNGDALSNVFILLTRADQVGDSLSRVKQTVAERISREAADTLKMATGEVLSAGDIEKRIVTFSVERPDLRDDFYSTLGEFLLRTYPKTILRSMEGVVSRVKKKAKGTFDRAIEAYTLALGSHSEAQARLDALNVEIPKLRESIVADFEESAIFIADCKDKSTQRAAKAYDKLVTPEAIEAFIESRFKDKKAASKGAADAVVRNIQRTVGEILEPLATELKVRLEENFENYDHQFNLNAGSVGVDFDSRAAFIGGISGLSSIGALSAWATAVAGGSNLGAYILVAKIGGWLTTLGIIGSPTVLTVIVAALGGPLAVGVYLSALIAAGIGIITLSSWQKRLAKKVASAFKKNNVKGKISEAVEKFWDDALIALVEGGEALINQLSEEHDQLEALVNDVDHEKLQKLLEEAEESRDFFGGIPWKSSKSIAGM